jgi:signal transduction histidine kinase
MKDADRPEATREPIGWGGTGILLGTVLSVLCFCVATWSHLQVRGSFNRASEQQRYFRDLQQLFSHIQDAETGSRGFALTGVDIYLSPFKEALLQVGPLLDALKAGISGEAQKESLDEMTGLWQRRLDTASEVIAVRREKGLDAAADFAIEGEGKRIMDGIRALFDVVAERQRAIISDELALTERFANLTIGSMAAGSIAGLLTGALLLGRLRRENRERRLLLLETVARGRQLEETNEALSRANQELQHFAYVASHDLQEPLRSVAGYVQLLERRYAGQLDEKALGYIHKSVAAAQRMQQLIEGLLAYTRVGTHGDPFQMVSVDKLLQDVSGNLAASLEETGARLTCQTLPEVWGDRLQLSQLFQNLIGNALKFRREEAVEVRISALREAALPGTGPGYWRFTVRDNGIGIDPEYAGRIFKVFQRLHTRQEYPGTGVGLAICKRIVERHGGRIWFDSEPGAGTAFHFTLPAGSSTPKEA